MFRWISFFSVFLASCFMGAPACWAQNEDPCTPHFSAHEYNYVWPALQSNYTTTKTTVEEQLLRADANTPASLNRNFQNFVVSVLDYFTKRPEDLQPALDRWLSYYLQSVQPYLPGLNEQSPTSMEEVADLAVRGDWELFLNVYGNVASSLNTFKFFCDRSAKPRYNSLLMKATDNIYLGTMMHAYSRQLISRTILPVPTNFLLNQHAVIENLIASFEGTNEP